MALLFLLVPGLIVPLEFFLVAFGIFPFAPPQYRGAPMEARVVDKVTGQPVADAIVVAHWQFESLGGRPEGQAQVFEVVTDTEGRFRLPEWGPVRRPATGTLQYKAPELLVFAPGYRFLSARNNVNFPVPSSILRKSTWDGQDMTLLREADQTNYAYILEQGQISLESLIDSECSWKKAPRMMAALAAIGADLKPAADKDRGNPYAIPTGIPYRPKTLEELGRTNQPFEAKCGPLNADVLQELQGH